ncbi:MAG: flagellar biosynthetic protein FliR [Clostridiales bacterium]|nr:flagellar biosynthetic protein FliR [Clostridiales bacterium]
MSKLVALVLGNADYFLLLLFRVSGLIFPSPLFGRVNIPAPAKISLCLAITAMFFVYRPNYPPISYHSLLSFAFICLAELLLGIVLAFITNLFFTLAFTAGHMIDMQIGFGIVNVYDMQNNTQIPMIGNLLNIMLLVVFFAVNGHHRLISIIDNTLTALPLGHLVFNPQIGLVAMEVFALSFTLGIMIALPVIASGLVLEICFGVIVRSVPQINMFVVGIPLKLLVGFVILLVVAPVFVSFSETVFTEMFIGVEKMFAAFITAS